MDTTKAISHLSLCSGYEGIGLGLRAVLPSLREIAYAEIEAFAIANLVAKMEEGQLAPAPIYTNLKTFPYRKFCDRVDILSGGFPCQPFSSAGQRKGVEDERHLFPHIAKGIAECRPRFVFLENVEGIITSKTTNRITVLQHVLGCLEVLGYKATAGIFSAAEVGAPHQRRRVFILAYDRSARSSSRVSMPRQRKKRHSEIIDDCSSRGWPSRCGEQPKDWEEPKLESKLGRTTNGTSSRVDRLRLLGNGVVPQVAAKAFITLLNKL